MKEDIYSNKSEDVEHKILSPILYLVPHYDQDLDEASPLQRFTPDVIAAAPAYTQIATMPKHIFEFFGGNNHLTQRTAGTPYFLTPIEVGRLQELFDAYEPFYCCIWSISEEIAVEVETFIGKQSRPIFHASPSKIGNSERQVDVSRESIRNYVLQVFENQETVEGKNELIAELREVILKSSESEPTLLDLPNYYHLMFYPNQIALQSAGFTFENSLQLPNFDGLENLPYFDAQRALVQRISDARRSVFKEKPEAENIAPCDLILTAPSVVKQWRKLQSLWEDLPKEERRQVQFYIKQIVGRKTFKIVGDSRDAVGAVTNPRVMALNHLHVNDLEAYTAALCVRASASFAPVVRLPTSVNNVHGELIQLEKTAAANNPSAKQAFKLSKLAKQVSLKLTEDLPEWVIDRIRESKKIKLIADAPLEWISVDGVPLTLQANVSRIPTTPGNLFFHKTVVSPVMPFRKSQLDEILVLRAFRKDDRIRNHLTVALEHYRKVFVEGKPVIKYVDVETKDDLVAALNSYSGAVAVFDGHGKHDSADDIGSLQLPNEFVSPWELHNEIHRMPPIIILSACDTHPFTASHATTASGFLSAGAVAVVGTSLPVDAKSSAEYVARLIFRMSRFIPIALKQNKIPLRWSGLVAGLQRRQYMTEVLSIIEQPAQINRTDKFMFNLGAEIGTLIDQEDKNWLNALFYFFAKFSSKTETEIKELVNARAYLTDALLHMQFGNPEHIHIIDG
jgi:hypothetical protein